MDGREKDKILLVTQTERRVQNGHKEMLVWLTGLSASGKTTLSCVLERELFQENIQVCRLDGDDLRKGINRGLGYTKEDRHENICRIGEVSRLLLDAGFVVIVAAISPYREGREYVRQLVDSERFIEVYVKCALVECEKRDTKGLYHQARNGEITHFTGITSPYEEPVAPQMVLETDLMPIGTSVSKLKAFIMDCIALATKE